MTKKTVPTQPQKKSTPSPTPRMNPNAPKPIQKTVPVSLKSTHHQRVSSSKATQSAS